MAESKHNKPIEPPEMQQPKVDGGGGHSVHPEKEPGSVHASDIQQANIQVDQAANSKDGRLIQSGRAQQTTGR